MNDFFVSNSINHRLRSLHLSHCGALVAGGNGFLHFFHGRAQLGAQGGVMGALLVVLTGALFCLGGIGHGVVLLCVIDSVNPLFYGEI